MTRFYRRLRLPALTLMSMVLTLLLLSSFASGTASAAARPSKQHHSIHPATVGVGYGPDAVTMGDFNGDGSLDMAVANGSVNTVSVLLGRGDGTFAPQVTYPVGSNPSSIAVGDFNGDGKPDLVNTNRNDNTISVLLGNGDGTFAPQVTYPVGNNPDAVALGDLNGDHIPDLAVANGSGNTVSILLDNGDGTFTSNTVHVTGQNFNATAGASFTGIVASVIGAEQASDLSATINWGDGTTPSTGTVSGADPYTITGTHTYSTGGNYTVTISVADSNLNMTSTGTATATVNGAALKLTHFLAGPLGHLVAGLGATFTDAGSQGKASDYTATINWGDGTTATVRVVKNPLGKGFVLAGLHRYARKGMYMVTLTVRDSDGSQLSKTVTMRVK